MVAKPIVDEDTLDIPIPEASNLVLDDYRRLTGPGLLWDNTGAIFDVLFQDFDPEDVIKSWQVQVHRVLDALNWGNQETIERRFDGGVTLALSAPMDQLYSAMFAGLTAWHFCAADLLGQTPGDFDAMVLDLKQVMIEEANPALIALIDAAAKHGIDILSDDEEVSIGHGIGSQVWPVTNLPAPQDVPWHRLHDIPVAMITGTNGKTTTTRLSAAIAKAGGKISGLTSTDFVRVGDDILDRGDYSGPGGGRMLLRDPRLEIAYLEVARGGLLQRGLPLRRARAALVGNVAADHLGQYGISTVEEMAEAKFAVHRTLAEDGVLVLNADDPYIVAEANHTLATVWWYSLDPVAPQISDALANGAPCAWLDNNHLMFHDGKKTSSLIHVNEIPITMGGAARYNILNALGAVCLSYALGLSSAAIITGLSGFGNNPQDNPGRCNEFRVNDARVFVDFAHNPHSISAVIEAMASIPAKRRFILLGHAGDRSDQDILDVTQCALSLQPDYVVAAEVPEYLRGRKLGEVTALIQTGCKEHGLRDDQVIVAQSPAQGVAEIMQRLLPEDLALLLVLSERDKVFEMLEQAGTT